MENKFKLMMKSFYADAADRKISLSATVLTSQIISVARVTDIAIYIQVLFDPFSCYQS